MTIFDLSKKVKNMTVEYKINHTTYHDTVSIVGTEYDYKQTLKDGRWVKSDELEAFETVLLTIGKYFDTYQDAEEFIKTKYFQKLFKLVQKEFSNI